MYKQGCHSDMHIFPTSIDFLTSIIIGPLPMNTKALQVSPVLKKVCYLRFVKSFSDCFCYFCGPPISRSLYGVKISHTGWGQRRAYFDGSGKQGRERFKEFIE